MKVTQRFVFLVAVLLLVAGSAFGQGTTGALSGTVSHEGAPLPGVTVTISSPALQGTRVAVSNVNGDYNFVALPPGDYTIRFEMEGMANITKTMRIGLAQNARANAAMQLTAVAEAITVTATASAVSESNDVQTNFDSDLVQELPLNRTFQSTANMAPGVTTNTPNANQLVISGAPASESLYLVNGAVVNENVRSQIHNLFIEEAIEEQTVLTGSISAEYGRFSGGVVTAITKSGGNEFTGSLRDNFTNPDWTKKTPLPTEPDHLDTINEVYEATFGGRIIRDRLWFFVAGRYFDTEADRFLKQTPEGNPATDAFTFGQTNERYEVKLTGQISSKHNIIASYLDNATDEVNICFAPCYEISNVDPSRTLPNDFITARYSGVLTSNLLVEAGYSKKKFTFGESGGDFTDFARGTWGYDLSDGGFFGAPVFCGICGDEDRDNENINLKGTYYLATAAAGTHNIVVGYDDFSESRLANNFQSGSGFEVYVYTSPTRDADGTLLPTVAPGDYIQWTPILSSSLGSDLTTQSIFVNDSWDLNNKWSFNIGGRYDTNDSVDSSGNKTSDDSAFSPRLGLSYDIKGDGRFRINAGYAQYVSHVQETIGGSGASGAGNPAYIGYYYDGPEISGVPTVEAFTQVYDWFTNVAGFDPATGTGAEDYIIYAVFPGVNTVIQESLSSPSTEEFTIGMGTQFGNGGYFRFDYIDRDYKDFYSLRKDLSTGKVEDPFGSPADLGVYENGDYLERTYVGVLLQGGYRFGQNLSLGANYTWSETEGNFVPETSGSGPVVDQNKAYPEYKEFAQNNPVGLLAGVDATHKARIWLTYNLSLNAFGDLTFGLLENYDSGTAFSDVAAIRTRNADNTPWLANPGYVTPPSTVNYYFSDRGAHRWDDATATDLSLTYTLPIKGINLWAKADVLNVFDEDAQIGGNSTILTGANSSCLQTSAGPTPGARCLNFNPLTGQTPVEGVHYRKGGTYGVATSTAHYQLPQTYRFSVGLRF